MNKNKEIKMLMTTRKSFIYVFLMFISWTVLSAQESDRLEPIKTDLKYLSSDELEGRLPGTQGNKLAAEYIVSRFREIGLLPINNSYAQEFKIKNEILLTDENKTSFTKIVEKPGLPEDMWLKAKKDWTLGNEYRPVSISSNGTAEGEVAFVGYGISAKEFDYDDYKDIDVKGKIVIIISDSADGKPQDERFIKYAKLKYKAKNAEEHGAVGVIFVKRLSDSANTFYPLKVQRFGEGASIPVIQANRTEIAKFFPKDRNLYPTELALLETKEPQSFILPRVKVSITTELMFGETTITNIMGMIKGTDPVESQEFIVIGAHYDHIGWGEFNSSYKGKPAIHNGADDNASGTSAIIELARVFKANPPRHSVVFIAFNAEEMGLLGSSYFANNSPIEITKVITMVNLDMVGRLDENLTVFGTGTAEIFNSIVDNVALRDSLTLTKNNEGYGPSDHTSFALQKVPVLFLFTGAHSDYHAPGDDYEKINFDGIVRVVNFTEGVLRDIDSRNYNPEFIEQNNNGAGGRGRGEIKVSFGSIPDFAENPDGFAIAGCRPGSPCEKSGMQKGDVMVSFNGIKTGNIMDFTKALKTVSPGDVVTIEYLHDGKMITKEVKLETK